jgi:hypothetical protein
MIGILDTFLVPLHLVTINKKRIYKPYSPIADLHIFQFTAAHALGFQSPLVVAW